MSSKKIITNFLWKVGKYGSQWLQQLDPKIKSQHIMGKRIKFSLKVECWNCQLKFLQTLGAWILLPPPAFTNIGETASSLQPSMSSRFGKQRFGVRICSRGGISEWYLRGKGNRFLGGGRVGLVLVVEVFLHVIELGWQRVGLRFSCFTWMSAESRSL